MPHGSSSYPETVHCSMCLGTGAMDIDTDGPWYEGRRPNAKVTCKDCQGFGQFTDCPCCRGAGCYDCDGGMVAGP
jgi:DnaJ-class molecular chaperone